MRARLQSSGAFRLAAVAATVMTTLCVTTSADARRASSSESFERHQRSSHRGWHGGEGTSLIEERSYRSRSRSAGRRHARRGHSAKTHQFRVHASLTAPDAVAQAWDGERNVERPAPVERQERRRLHRQNDAWSSAPAPADAPAYAYEPAAETASGRVFRGHETASQPTHRRLASTPVGDGGGGGGLVAEARRWIGTNPTNRRSLWCGAFMNFVLQRSGHEGTGSDLAKSFASLGRRVSGPQIGAIAVMSRRGGGHVGVVSGIDSTGNPIIISGNSRGRRVAEGAYPRGRIYAYVMP